MKSKKENSNPQSGSQSGSQSDPRTGRVLIIAGSDSSGGAGVQADIKTCAAFGTYSMSAITAVTAQNTQGVQAVEFMTADLVRAQIRSALDDIGADIIKIGMLGNAEIIRAVSEEIKDTDAFIILDPVMIATSGDRLMEGEAEQALKEVLIPVCDLITPNVPEASALTGIDISNMEDMTQAGAALLDMGLYGVLMKGGHLQGKAVIDILVTHEGANLMSGPRIHSRHTHGTGCTLASAVAATMALGAPLDEAVMSAREFVFEAIRTAPGLGQTSPKSHGPLNHGLLMIGEDGHHKEGGEDDLGAEAGPHAPEKGNPFAVLKDLKPS